TDNLSARSVTVMLGFALAGLAVWWGVIVYSQFRPVRWRGFRLDLPSLGMTLKQTVVAVVDLIVAGLVLYLLLSSESDVPLGRFMLVYIMAQLLGLLSQVPGGIGVFESTFLVLTSDQ